MVVYTINKTQLVTTSYQKWPDLSTSQGLLATRWLQSNSKWRITTIWKKSCRYFESNSVTLEQSYEGSVMRFCVSSNWLTTIQATSHSNLYAQILLSISKMSSTVCYFTTSHMQHILVHTMMILYHCILVQCIYKLQVLCTVSCTVSCCIASCCLVLYLLSSVLL